MRVRAMQSVFYGGRDRLVGEEFDTENDLHGKVLMVSGRVVAVETDKPEPGETETPAKRGRYKHRRMQADE